MKITEKKLKEIIREEMQNVLQEEDPCWEGYTMVGMKEKNGKKVPNCVPDDEVDNYEEK